jgi:hypothetical protein
MNFYSVTCRVHAPLLILLYVIIFLKFYLPQLNNIKVVQLEIMSKHARTENYISVKVTLYYLCVNAFRNGNSILSLRIPRKSRSYTLMLQFYFLRDKPEPYERKVQGLRACFGLTVCLLELCTLIYVSFFQTAFIQSAFLLKSSVHFVRILYAGSLQPLRVLQHTEF